MTRVDHRVLGAGTTPRFVLLLVLFAASSVQLLSGLITDPVFPGIHGHRDNAVGCLLAAGVNPSGAALPGYLATIRTSAAYDACMARYGWNPPWWWPYAAAGLLVAVAAGLYWALPAWKGRRSRAVPVSALADGSDLRAVLAELTVAAGLARTPRFVIDPAAASTSAVVFGRFRRYTVCLHAGLVACRVTDPALFRAVVLHELAHLRNHDVPITYATVVMWRVYLIAALLPTVVSEGWLLFSGDVLGQGARSIFRPAVQVIDSRDILLSAFLVVLVYLARADILRHREMYADLDSAHWGADASHWHPARAGRPAAGPLRRALAAFTELWRTHPAWDRRQYSLTDTSPVFAVSSLQMFLVGAAALVTSAQLAADLDGFLPRPLRGELSVGLVAGLVAAIAGVALWRAATHAVLTGRPAPSGLRAGLWLGAGMAAGELMLFRTAAAQLVPHQPATLLLLVLFAATTTCWTAEYAAVAARSWRGRSARPVMLAGLTAAWLLLAVTLGWWQTQGTLYATGWPFSTAVVNRYLTGVLPGPVIPGHAGTLTTITTVIAVGAVAGGFRVLLTALVLWLLPLLAWAGRAPAGPPRWLLRAVPAGLAPPGTGGLPPLRRILLPGLAGGAACWAGIAGVMAYLHTWHIPLSQRFGSFLLIFLGWLTVAVAGGAVAAAAAAASLVPRCRLLAGLIAAGVAELIGFAGVFIQASADGCIGPLTTMAPGCGWRPVAGWQAVKFLPVYVSLGVFAVAVAAAVAGLMAALATRLPPGRQRRAAGQAPGEQPTVPRRPRVLAARRAAIALICAAAVVLAVLVSGYPFASQGSGTAPPITVSQLTADGPANPAPPTVRRLQLAAWVHFGGRQLLPPLYRSLRRMGAETEVLASALPASRHPARYRQAVAGLAGACAALGRAAAAPSRYFPLPDPALQHLWSAGLTGIQHGTAQCGKALRRPGLTGLLTALHQLQRAAGTLLLFSGQLQAGLRHVCMACL